MTLTYQHPVVYFYGDDEEDSEIIRKEGQIEPLKQIKSLMKQSYPQKDTAFYLVWISGQWNVFMHSLDGIWDVNLVSFE